MLRKVRTKSTSIKPTAWFLWLAFFGALLLGGLVGGVLVFWKGLAVAHLTDALWITR